jgi:hypothetical protein
MNNEKKNGFTEHLIGTGEVCITLKKGSQHSIPYVHKRFSYAQWTFRADASFLLTAPPEVQDLVPLVGTHTSNEAIIEFACEQQLSKSTTVTVDGIIHLQAEPILLQAIYMIDSKEQMVAQIHQLLSQAIVTAEPVPEVPHIDSRYGITVPTVFGISVRGTVDAQPFGPLAGTLEIRQCSSPTDTNPFIVELNIEESEKLKRPGAIFWTSFCKQTNMWGEVGGMQISIVELLTDSQIAVRVSNNQYPFPSWSTLGTLETPMSVTEDICEIGTEIGLTDDEMVSISATLHVQKQLRGELDSNTKQELIVSATATDGILTFSIQDDLLSGEIHARGHTLLEHASTYDASLTGKRLR